MNGYALLQHKQIRLVPKIPTRCGIRRDVPDEGEDTNVAIVSNTSSTAPPFALPPDALDTSGTSNKTDNASDAGNATDAI